MVDLDFVAVPILLLVASMVVFFCVIFNISGNPYKLEMWQRLYFPLSLFLLGTGLLIGFLAGKL